MVSVALTPKQKSDAQKDIVQETAVRKVVKHFKSHNRGQLAMFCGTGKTRTAIKAIKRLKSRVVVVCVPTLGLASQWINDFAKYGDKRELLAVCSKLHNETPEDYGIVGYTTNKDVVRAFAKSKGKLLIVSTYQSYDVIQAAWRRTKLAPIDLLIADEAHNTAGKNSKHMGLCLHDSGAKVAKRLFMTATRRLYRGDKDDYNCMDDTAVYGDVIYELTLREAIDRGIVSDYSVYVINVYKDLRPEDFANINSCGFESELLAKFVSEKIMKDKAVRVFTFHNRVDDATEFAQHVEASGKWAKVLTGEHKVKDREVALRTFQSHKQSSLIASVNVLGEGIDVPSNDVIVFADKMTEPQAIIQRMGRGTRMVDGKKKLRIILPVYVDPQLSDAEAADVAEKSLHKDTLNVIRALASYDPKFYKHLYDFEVKRRTRGHDDEFDNEEDDMLVFDGMSPACFEARLMPQCEWPEYSSGVKCIEKAIAKYFRATHRLPTERSSRDTCPELFSSWGSVSMFLRTFGCESFAEIKLRVTGASCVVNGTAIIDDVYIAFDAFIKKHARPPKSCDGHEMAPKRFTTWKRVDNYLRHRGSSLSKFSIHRGVKLDRRSMPTMSIKRIESLAKKKIQQYVKQHGRLPRGTEVFLFGRTTQWFIKYYRVLYNRIRRKFGMSRSQTQSDVLSKICAFYKRHSRPPTKDDMPSEATWFFRRGVCWRNAMRLAGLNDAVQDRLLKRLDVIVRRVRKWVAATNTYPLAKDMMNEKQFVYTQKPFGISSWPKFVDHVLSMPSPQKATK